MAEIPVGYRSIEGSERRPAPGARRVSAADPNEQLSFTIRLRRLASAPPMPDQNYWTANPPGGRRFLTRDELVAQSSAAQADIDKVADFARSHGMQVVGTSAARRTVRISGTVAQANSAFAVDLGRYESPEENYRGREGPINLPNDVADVVQGVFGLDNRRMAHRAGGVPSGAFPVTPPQVANLYNFPPLKAAGQTIGILEFGGGFAQTDLNTFWNGLGAAVSGPAPVPQLVSVDGQSTTTYAGSLNNPNNSDLEVALDVQVAASVAQGANIVMFFAPFSDDGWIDAVTTAIYETPANNNSPDLAAGPRLTALSISWGKSEDLWSSNAMSSVSEVFQDAAALGIAIFVASGDFGSNGQNNDGNAHVQYPSSDPWVTACGGTYIANTNQTPFTEGTWNDPSGATTGGVSVPTPANATFPLPGTGFLTSVAGTGFPVPPWQNGLSFLPPGGLPTQLTGRGVPDVAGNASAFSGYGITVYGSNKTIGGTSAVAPLYAALVAIIAAKVGWPLGYLNPILYAIYGTANQTSLVDINDGVSNELNAGFVLPSGATAVPCPAYLSTPGWDACTGLGRINGTALMDALVLLEQTRPFDADYPFNFGGGGGWLNYLTPPNGSQASGEFIVAGRVNGANENDSTYLLAIANNSAVLAGENAGETSGGVGVYGRSHSLNWSIGVAGVAPAGCGMYGIAAGTRNATRGIGVAGRSMGGVAAEFLPLESVVGEPVGVLGHSAHGAGVRGHGGTLLKQPQAGEFLPAAPAAPGGSFSSGRLNDQVIPGARTPQTVGLDALAQLHLVPSTDARLPVIGQIGDLFLVYVQIKGERVRANTANAQLWLCTRVVNNIPQWEQVQLGVSTPGGTAL
jgi:kumamolisin